MKKSILSLLAWSLPFLLLAQRSDDYKGIKWVEGLTWEQIKQKAKAEDKYIFLDCFATWCGPCKLMDKDVYTADSVGEFFNEKFIAVKVQMDKTDKDDEDVKKWYADADSINKKYHIESFPSFLFFNSQGQVTEKKSGYKRVEEFVALGKSATVPGKLYNDPYEDYYKKIAAYKEGERNYDAYPSMIRTAEKLGDTSVAKQLRKEFTDYAASLPPKERYTKERIEFWNSYLWTSNSKVFGFFYKDAPLINKVVDKKGYAENIVDKTIQYEIVTPFFKGQAKGSGYVMEGPYPTYIGKGDAPNASSSEADWAHLENLIRLKHGKDYAKRNVLKARVDWYSRHYNKNAELKYSLELFNNHYPADIKDWPSFGHINNMAWAAFLRLNDKSILKGYAKWMKKVAQVLHRGNETDTYANLLYKLGYKKKAIEWEEKALKLSPRSESIFNTLELMKKGKPTGLDEGAIWPKTAKK